MRDYYTVFQNRSNAHGTNFKDAVRNQTILNFKRFLRSSPNAVDVLVNNQGDPVRVATLTDRENDTLYKRYFLCDKSDNIKIGDFLYWDNSIWLVFKRVVDTIDVYDKFDCIECRHHIKWIDKFGVLKETPCYLVAQTDEKIKTNFRTWNNMITPQPNKTMEIITSRTNIGLGQKFLIDETAWFVVESDYISVKDILYLSLTEDKKDLYTDDIENNIADIIDLNKFVLNIQSNNVNLGIGEEYQIDGRITLNGLHYSNDIELEVIEGQEFVEIDNELKIKAIGEGTVKARVYMEDHPEIYQNLNIIISEKEQEPLITYELRGDESIKWGRTKIYQMIKIVNGIEELVPCTFEIEDLEQVLMDYEINNSTISITANDKNEVGSIKIIATVDDINYEKEVKVVSLWM